MEQRKLYFFTVDKKCHLIGYEYIGRNTQALNVLMQAYRRQYAARKADMNDEERFILYRVLEYATMRPYMTEFSRSARETLQEKITSLMPDFPLENEEIWRGLHTIDITDAPMKGVVYYFDS